MYESRSFILTFPLFPLIFIQSNPIQSIYRVLVMHGTREQMFTYHKVYRYRLLTQSDIINFLCKNFLHLDQNVHRVFTIRSIYQSFDIQSQFQLQFPSSFSYLSSLIFHLLSHLSSFSFSIPILELVGHYRKSGNWIWLIQIWSETLLLM